MAISKDTWEGVRVLFESGKSLKDIELDTGINKGTISRKAKKCNWVKMKLQPLKDEIKDFEEEKATLDAKKSNLVDKIATLSDFDITKLDGIIADEIGIKSSLFSTASLAVIRANQMLTKNKKTVMSKVDLYEDGKKIATQYEEKEISLSMNDYKESIELTDKASITLGVNPRHAGNQVTVNTQNNLTSQVLTIDDIYGDN